MSITTEVVRNVWHDKEGCAISVGPDGDGLDMVRVRTLDTKSAEYFGKIDFALTFDIARALGQAIIDAAKEAEEAQRPF